MSKLPGDQYYTIENVEVSNELKIKGSRFIASIFHVRSKREAEDRYDRVRRKFHDATHNCFAYRINENIYRYSDDGEPSGTAGRQIMRILEQNDLHQILIVVSRYFGGIKLGRGGLSRAYADAAKQILHQVNITVRIKYKTITLETDYDHMNEILTLVNNFNGIIGKSNYTEKVLFSVQIPCIKFSLFQREVDALINRGFVKFHIEEA